LVNGPALSGKTVLQCQNRLNKEPFIQKNFLVLFTGSDKALVVLLEMYLLIVASLLHIQYQV
ncbi:MAG: hypothetical protein ABW159_17685, partial [Candidatus Thiodiazotropha sp.]